LSNLTDQKKLELGRNLANPWQTEHNLMVVKGAFARMLFHFDHCRIVLLLIDTLHTL